MSASGSTNRRRFLVSVLGSSALLYREMGVQASNTTRWAFLADTHIEEDPAHEYRGFKPSENLQAVVSRIVPAAPSGVVLVGDAARVEGKTGDYRQLRTLLQPLQGAVPTMVGLGNTDHRANFLTEFPESLGVAAPVTDRHIRVVEAGPIRYILLDSLLRTRLSSGLLGKAQRLWLEGFLRSADVKPTLLFVHHTLDDRDISLLDTEGLFRVIQPHRMVKGIVHGHSHRYGFRVREGIHLINLPAVGYHFFETEPLGWIEARLGREGADLRLHAVAGNTALDGQQVSLTWRR